MNVDLNEHITHLSVQMIDQSIGQNKCQQLKCLWCSDADPGPKDMSMCLIIRKFHQPKKLGLKRSVIRRKKAKTKTPSRHTETEVNNS